MTTRTNLEVFFAPRSVAVVGASNDPESVGHALMNNLCSGPGAFAGPVFPINRKGGEICGRKVHESLAAVGEDIDLMVVAIPPKYIPGLMKEAGEVGVRGAVVISAGFSELGDEGRALQDEMLGAAQAAGIRIIGPNCLGIIRPKSRLNASFAAGGPSAGAIGLLSQSGALITGILSLAEREKFGLSAAMSLGAKADVDDVEMLELLGADPETRAIALYVEAFPEPRKFFEVALKVAAQKPVVAIKGGATAAGARAASSHTGSLAGSAAAYSAAFRQAGIEQARTIGEFMAWSRALAYQPVAAGNRLAIVTNAGGPGVLSADEATRQGIELAELSPQTMEELNRVLPSVWSRGNPVDIIGDATPERYRDALDIIGSAPEVDGVVVIMTVQAMTDPHDTANAIVRAHDNPAWKKPVLCSFIGEMGSEVGSMLDEFGIPEFNTPEEAVGAMGALMRRGIFERQQPAAEPDLDLPVPRPGEVRRLLDEAREAGQSNLDLERARAVLAAAGIRYNGSATASSADDAADKAEAIGFPVVIKLISPDVIHKSDVGGVVLNVASRAEVLDACRSIDARVREHDPDATITGYTVEEQVSGTEIIVGMSRDPGFGPMLMVGMGGIFVEVYKDVSFRLSPLSRRSALRMIEEIRAQPLLDGARARPVLNRDELAEVLLRVSRLVEDNPDIVELDLNPLVITPDRGLVAIDARVII